MNDFAQAADEAAKKITKAGLTGTQGTEHGQAAVAAAILAHAYAMQDVAAALRWGPR